MDICKGDIISVTRFPPAPPQIWIDWIQKFLVNFDLKNFLVKAYEGTQPVYLQ